MPVKYWNMPCDPTEDYLGRSSVVMASDMDPTEYSREEYDRRLLMRRMNADDFNKKNSGPFS